MEKGRVTKKNLKLIGFLAIVVVMIGFAHHLFFKNSLSESIFAFVGGILAGYVIRLIKPTALKPLILASITGYFLAAFLDPILKPLLDKIFGFNTVESLAISLIANFIVFLFFITGILLGCYLLNYKPNYERKRSYSHCYGI